MIVGNIGRIKRDAIFKKELMLEFFGDS